MFDVDGDGHLNEAEVRLMVESMLEVAAQTRAQDSDPAPDTLDCDTLVRGLLCGRDQDPARGADTCPGHVTLEEFLVWTVDNVLAREMGQLVVQLCHVVLGLR